MARSKPALSALAKRFAACDLKPARVVLTPVIAVPTRFVQVDFATRVWGWPIQRAAVIHGPSNEGKTAFALGLCGSFVDAGGMCKLDDAERTTTEKWGREMLGETFDSDRFIATRPLSYEDCVDESRAFHRAVKEAREAGELPEHASAIQIVDSLRKLNPKKLIDKLAKEGADAGVDGMGGRAAQVRAALNASWLDELVPLVDECRTAWVAIARESEDTEATTWDKKFGNDYKVQGGKAVVYDSALRLRIERAGWTYVERDGKKVAIGERHKVSILKTKIGSKDGRASVAYFHTKLDPVGFDRSRDVAELAKQFGVIESTGAGVQWKGQKWRSYERFVEAMDADGDRETLEAEVRARFEENEPEEEKEE